MSFNSVNAFMLKFLELHAPDAMSQWEETTEEFKILFKKPRKENPEKPEKPKKKKQAGEPKKAKSAYLFFCELEREKLKVEMPDLKGKDIMVELGIRWKLAQTLPEYLEDIKEKAQADKERYEEEKKNYVPEEKVEDEIPKTKKTKKTKKPKAEGAPKMPKSAFQFFCVDERINLKNQKSELKGKEILKELGIRWQLIKVTKAAKKYEKMAVADQARYQAEKEEWFKAKWAQDSVVAEAVSEPEELSDPEDESEYEY
jgi:hypothetical protein